MVAGSPNLSSGLRIQNQVGIKEEKSRDAKGINESNGV